MSWNTLICIGGVSFHRIIEWPGLKSTTMTIYFQPPCYVQGRQPGDQTAQSHIQPGLECLQGWGIHSLLGQPVQCVTTLWGKNFLLISTLNLPCLSKLLKHGWLRCTRAVMCTHMSVYEFKRYRGAKCLKCLLEGRKAGQSLRKGSSYLETWADFQWGIVTRFWNRVLSSRVTYTALKGHLWLPSHCAEFTAWMEEFTEKMRCRQNENEGNELYRSVKWIVSEISSISLCLIKKFVSNGTFKYSYYLYFHLTWSRLANGSKFGMRENGFK